MSRLIKPRREEEFDASSNHKDEKKTDLNNILFETPSEMKIIYNIFIEQSTTIEAWDVHVLRLTRLLSIDAFYTKDKITNCPKI